MKTLCFIIALLSSPAVFAVGEILKLNTAGTQYCSGFKPQRFGAGNDVDLWVRIDSAFQATVYGDAGLTDPIATLDLDCTVISPTKAACSIFSGDSSDHFAAVGTLKFDQFGLVKNINGTLVRRGILNSCFAKATVTGRRIN
jgi:hypothetical protein